MRESYCGKNCAECPRREELNCPGCRPEEGRRFPTSCIIAACCNQSGHETCEGCVHKQNFCQTLKEKDDYPQRHIREQEYEARKREEARQQMEERRERGTFLLKRFNILCILWIIGFVCNLIDLVAGKGTVFSYAESVIGVANLCIIYGMARINSNYKTVVYIGLFNLLVNLVSGMTDGGLGLAFLIVLLSLPGVYGSWLELNTHGEVLYGIDDDAAARWQVLAKRYVWTFCLMIGGTFLMLLWTAFAVVMLAGTIALIVVSIQQIIHTFRTRMVLSLYVEANVPKA